MFDRRLIVNFDFFLLFAVLLICFLSVVNLKSIYASSRVAFSFVFYKQIYWIFVGLFFLFITINIQYLSIIRISYSLHFFSWILLVFVLVFENSKFVSLRWINLGGISFQPSELAKITFILALSKFFSDNISEKVFKTKDLLFPFIILLITFLTIYMQPDLGTAGIMILVFLSMICFLNINRKSVYIFFSVSLVVLPFFWFLLRDYQKRRILVFLNPELDPLNTGYQVLQSKIAIGSGELLGKGYQLGTQSQLRFLPEQHTDFVFSVWAEEWGFVGCILILLLYFFIIYRGFSIAYNSKNFYARFLAIGLSFLFFWQIIINIFMTMGFFPVVGVPLPFFSYGGSSLLSFMLAIGLLLNINMRKFK